MYPRKVSANYKQDQSKPDWKKWTELLGCAVLEWDSFSLHWKIELKCCGFVCLIRLISVVECEPSVCFHVVSLSSFKHHLAMDF